MHRFVQDTIGLKGVIFTPPYIYSPINLVELFFSRLKHKIRREHPTTVEHLLTIIRNFVTQMPAVHIKNWYKKSGFQTGDEEKTIELKMKHTSTGACSIPKDAEFTDRAEAIVCADEQNTVRRLKKPRHKKWTIYTDDDEFDGDLQNISVVKRSGVKTKKQKVYHC